METVCISALRRSQIKFNNSAVVIMAPLLIGVIPRNYRYRQAGNSSSCLSPAVLFMSLTQRAISRGVSGTGARPWCRCAVNAVYFTSATSTSETQQPSWSSHSARG
jgi:hypothetical protein